MKRRIHSLLSPLLKIAFATGLIYWLVVSGRLDFTDFAILAQPLSISIGLAFVAVNLILCSERWRLILANQDIHMSFFETMKLSLIGVFFNYFVPGGVGGDVVKGYYIAKENPGRKVRSVVTIAMDRLLGLFNLLLMALVVMIFEFDVIRSKPELMALFTMLVLLFCGFMVLWVLIFSRRINEHGLVTKLLGMLPHSEKFMRLYQSFTAYSASKKTFFQAMVLSFVAQSLSVGLFALIGFALGYDNIPLSTYFFVVPIGFIVQAVPISPGGIGVGQAAFYYLFHVSTGLASSPGATAITAIQILQFAFGLIGAGFYVTLKRKIPKLETQVEGSL